MVGLFARFYLPKSPNNLGNNFWVITNAFGNHWATSYTKTQGLAIAARGSQWWACLLEVMYPKGKRRRLLVLAKLAVVRPNL